MTSPDPRSPPPSSSPDELRRRLLALAGEEGFDLAGVATVAPSSHGAFLREWIAEGRHGEMGYLARPDALRRREDPALGMPGARSALVVAHNYFQPDPEGVPEDPARGVIARYARGRDYHKVVKKGLERVHRRLEEALGEPVPARAYTDTGPLLERELAARAGLGWFGRNTMLIHPRRGSYLFLGVLLLDLELEADAPFEADHCGTCRACLDACPTGALLGRTEEGAPVMDARLCISYLTIENRGPIPRELRRAIGNRVYGCDICQEVCPFNVKFAEEAAEPGYAARGPGERPVGVEALSAERADSSGLPHHPGTNAPSLVDLLSMALSAEAWESFSRGSAIRRAGRAGFARNLCVGLGNWASPEAVPVLTSALSDPEPLVRGHAAWALGRVSSPGASAALRGRAVLESDAWVSSEIRSALEGSSPTRK